MEQPRSGEFWWLIEHAGSPASAPLYFPDDVKQGPTRWTADHNAAMRFASEPEAKAYAAEKIAVPVRVCEHGWS